MPWARQSNFLSISFRKTNNASLCGLLCWFPKAAIIKYRELVGLDNRNLLSHGSGSFKSKIKVLAGLLPSDSFKEKSVPCLSSSFWGLLEISGVPRLTDVSLQSLLCLHVASLCVCVPGSKLSSSIKDIGHLGPSGCD